MTCPEPQCGHPQEGPGHPRKGWVRVSVTGAPPAVWFCSPAHAIAYLVTDKSGDIRHDVAACRACAIRHDLDHRCRACGDRPAPPRPWSPRGLRETATAGRDL